jgi:hypothetical protein
VCLELTKTNLNNKKQVENPLIFDKVMVVSNSVKIADIWKIWQNGTMIAKILIFNHFYFYIYQVIYTIL